MPDWRALPDGVAWKSPPLFNFDLSRRAIVSRFGPAHMVDLDSNGVGLFDAWFLQFLCGLEVAVWQFHDRFDGESVRAAVGDDEERHVEIHATERERDHILFHLGLAVTTVHPWVPDHSYVGEAVWLVMRQDDNGNVCRVRSVTSRCEAKAIVGEFEMRGHKQTYWVDGPASV